MSETDEGVSPDVKLDFTVEDRLDRERGREPNMVRVTGVLFPLLF